MPSLAPNNIQRTDTSLTVTGDVSFELEWHWVSSYADCIRANRDEPTTGDVLYVQNLMTYGVSCQAGALLQAHRHWLPTHRHIAWFDNEWTLHTPKGVPESWH